MCRPFKVFESLELENQVEPINRAQNTTIVFHLTCFCLIKKMVMEKKVFSVDKTRQQQQITYW